MKCKYLNARCVSKFILSRYIFKTNSSVSQSGPRIEMDDRIKSILSREEWRLILQNKLETEEFEVLQTEILPYSEDMVGFLGEHYKANASVRLKDKEVFLRFFVKTIPESNVNFREYVERTRSFQKETYFFDVLTPNLRKFFKNASSDDYWTCKCYFSRDDVIVLEDLTEYGFEMCQHFDYDCCKAVLKTLATFHSASIIFEEKFAEATGDAVKRLDDIFPDIFFETEMVLTQGHPGRDLMKSFSKALMNVAEFLPKYGKSHGEFSLIKEKLGMSMYELCEMLQPSKKFRNVVCHGDLWENNIFIRHNSDNSTCEVRLVDFQLFRYNPPASDLAIFLHLVADRDFRHKHLNSLLSWYHNVLSEQLRRHELDPEKLLPWSQFKDSYIWYENLARVFVMPYFLQNNIPNEDIKHIFSDKDLTNEFMAIDKSRFVLEQFINNCEYKTKTSVVIEEMIEHCILNTA